LSSLGAILAEQKRFAEAEPMLLEGQRGVSADPNSPARVRQASLKRLVAFYESSGKSQQAARWRTRQAPEEDR
jgi:hypothetical protein